MRLIVISAIERQLRPGDIVSGVQPLHGALEALNPTPYLRRGAPFFAEDRGEGGLAPAGAPCDFAHRSDAWRASESAECKLYDAGPGETAPGGALGKPLQQKFFEAANSLVCALDFAQSIAQHPHRRAPDVFQGYDS